MQRGGKNLSTRKAGGGSSAGSSASRPRRKKANEEAPFLTLYDRSVPGQEFVWQLPLPTSSNSTASDIVNVKSYPMRWQSADYSTVSFYFDNHISVTMSVNLLSGLVRADAYSHDSDDDDEKEDLLFAEDGVTPIDAYNWVPSIGFWTPATADNDERYLFARLAFGGCIPPLSPEDSEQLLSDPSALETVEGCKAMLRLPPDRLLALANASSTPEMALRVLYRLRWAPVLMRLAQNPQTPKEYLPDLAWPMGILVARNPALPLYRLEEPSFELRLPLQVRYALDLEPPT